MVNLLVDCQNPSSVHITEGEILSSLLIYCMLKTRKNAM